MSVSDFLRAEDGQWLHGFGIETMCACELLPNGELYQRHTVMLHLNKDREIQRISPHCTANAKAGEAARRLGNDSTCWGLLARLRAAILGDLRIDEVALPKDQELREIIAICKHKRAERVRNRAEQSTEIWPKPLTMREGLRKHALPQLAKFFKTLTGFTIREETNRLFVSHVSVPLLWRRFHFGHPRWPECDGVWQVTEMAKTHGSEIAKAVVAKQRIACLIMKYPAHWREMLTEEERKDLG